MVVGRHRTRAARYIFHAAFPGSCSATARPRVLPIAQFASLFGVYGVSMLVASVSAALRDGVPPSDQQTRRDPSISVRSSGIFAGSRASLVCVIIALSSPIAAWGSRRAAVGASGRVPASRSASGIDSGQHRPGRRRWKPARAAAIFQEYLAHDPPGDSRRRRARSSGPSRPHRSGSRTIRWPPRRSARWRGRRERADPVWQRPVRARRRRGAPTTFYNSRVSRAARTATTGGVYRKMHLGAVRRVRAGQEPAVLRRAAGRGGVGFLGRATRRRCCRSGGHRLSTAICYEVVYPDLVRRFVAGGSELLTTITNDAWFGPTSAPHQHFEQASMRAIEEGRYLVRSANTGISGIVDPLRPRARAQRRSSSRRVVVGEARVADDVDVLRAARRRPRLCVGRRRPALLLLARRHSV